ncbi:MAG: hypothetical protein U1F77_01400 [Kiritimatiellia bacterium]
MPAWYSCAGGEAVEIRVLGGAGRGGGPAVAALPGIGEAVAAGVGRGGIQPGQDLVKVIDPVRIGVGQSRVQAARELLQGGEAVGIGIGQGVVDEDSCLSRFPAVRHAVRIGVRQDRGGEGHGDFRPIRESVAVGVGHLGVAEADQDPGRR